MTLPTDLALLAIQAEGAFDGRGRLRDLYGVTIACTTEGQSLWVGDGVPDDVATELIALFDRASPAADPAAPPSALEPCRRLLEQGGRVLRCGAGPSFVFPGTVPRRLDVHLERSDEQTQATLRQANPGNWHSVEWGELLDGRLGPWAMAIDGGRVVSICHTPRPVTARAAECGVWTHPAFRGRGLGAAVTAEWAAVMQSPGRHLFYSTDAHNLSSQGVARRLGLRPLGWTWRLALATDPDDNRVHPLCTLRR
jgi:RimJ/RimL family protein N-acetyltransferase